MRVIAIDWSGDARAAARRIWLAECDVAGRLRRLEGGRDGPAVIDHLIADIGPGEAALVGLDFAFSVPAWYAARLGAHTAPELWRRVEADGEGWLAECPWPFWGRPGHARPTDLPAHLRLCEQSQDGIGSVFQIGGAGSVGTASLRGMPGLLRLRTAGFAIWPFDDAARWPRVVEIWPRRFARPVRKSAHGARAAYVEAFHPDLPPALAELAVASEHAFDATVSALAMAAAFAAGAGFPPAADDAERLEGAIWPP